MLERPTEESNLQLAGEEEALTVAAVEIAKADLAVVVVEGVAVRGVMHGR